MGSQVGRENEQREGVRQGFGISVMWLATLLIHLVPNHIIAILKPCLAKDRRVEGVHTLWKRFFKTAYDDIFAKLSLNRQIKSKLN